MNVLICACIDSQIENLNFIYKIMKRMYTVTYPYWVVQYKHYGSFAASWSLIKELRPYKNKYFNRMNIIQKINISSHYIVFTILALLIPYKIFNHLQKRLHKLVRK